MGDKNQDQNFNFSDGEMVADNLDTDDYLSDQGKGFGLDAGDNEEGEELFDVSKTSQAEKKDEEATMISKSKIILIKKLLLNIKENNDKLIEMLSIFGLTDDDYHIGLGQIEDEDRHNEGNEEMSGKIIEGVFDGEKMIGPDGKQYSVPANYASKSKLVEGDILKLTITSKGIFIYKQIGPIERIRVVGKLEKEDDGNFIVKSEGRAWRVLPASVTYFKGNAGDETIILIPKTGESQWAAVENIVRKGV